MTSVKFRKGWDHQHVNAVEFARMCEDCGAAYVTMRPHRKRLLCGNR
ncbi:MAG: tRNA-dihydrouridine synthase [Alphaproteobacteria bacterium]